MKLRMMMTKMGKDMEGDSKLGVKINDYVQNNK